MTYMLFIGAVIAIFCAFGAGLAYAQIATKGLIAPGARPID